MMMMMMMMMMMIRMIIILAFLRLACPYYHAVRSKYVLYLRSPSIAPEKQDGGMRWWFVRDVSSMSSCPQQGIGPR